VCPLVSDIPTPTTQPKTTSTPIPTVTKGKAEDDERTFGFFPSTSFSLDKFRVAKRLNSPDERSFYINKATFKYRDPFFLLLIFQLTITSAFYV
jgi:hypothetical protein